MIESGNPLKTAVDAFKETQATCERNYINARSFRNLGYLLIAGSALTTIGAIVCKEPVVAQFAFASFLGGVSGTKIAENNMNFWAQEYHKTQQVYLERRAEIAALQQEERELMR